jgi:alpha/beta superfamily hydrolase
MVSIPVADFALEADAQLLPGASGVVVCHPHPAFGGRMDTPLVVALADALGAAGLSTVRFNFRGLDGSGGRPTGGAREHEDVMAVADWLRAAGAPRVALVGYSFGALMAARALGQGSDAFAFAAVGLPTTIIGDDPERVAHVEAAIARRVPSLFIAGDEDQFCEIDRIAAWIDGKSWAQKDVMHGCGHFFSDEQSRQVCTRVANFVSQC